jgi:GT2 family glycosyltransferase
MDTSVFLEQILFVIVLFKRKPEESPAFEAIRSLSIQSNHPLSLFIYDNSPEPAEGKLPFGFYHHDPGNGGVSKAYNEAFRVAGDLNKKWMLLLDQDTHIDEAFILRLPAVVQQHAESVAFVPILTDERGPVSPFRWSLGRGIRIRIADYKLPLKDFRFLNSGLLIACDAFQKAGGYHESIPLYFSDIAFGENLKKVVRHFVVIPVTIRHPFSASEKIQLNDALMRYRYFCIGAAGMGRIFGPAILYYLRALLRGLKLSAKYQSLVFLKHFLLLQKW